MEGIQLSEEATEDVFLQDDLGPTIAEHATICHSLFDRYMVMPEIVPDSTVIDDQLARFSLWASNMDVYEPPNVSLDYRLRFSPTAVDIIHKLLDLICDTLLSLKPIDHRTRRIPANKRPRLSVHSDPGARRPTEDYPSDSDSDNDPEEENISKITETIGGTITRLFRLSNAVRKSAKANRARNIERHTKDEETNKAIEEIRLYTKCYIEFRLPEAPEALRSALIEANAMRLRRLYYQQSHQKRISLRPSSTGIMFPKSAESTLTEVLRAESDPGNNKLSFPPMPPTQRCPYCGVIIEFKNVPDLSLWQNHVMRDLEPFICIFPECVNASYHGPDTSPLTFETSEAWSSHMQIAHGQTWECRAPSHDPIVFEQEVEHRKHSIKEHSVPEAYAATLSNAARRPTLDKVLECPFGDYFQFTDNVGSSNIFSTEGLELHVAGHMKEIALLALQKLPTDGNEYAETIDSDQSLEDEVTTEAFGIARASMVSMLGDELSDFPDGDDGNAAESDVEHRDEQISEGVTKLHLEGSHGMSELHLAVQDEDLDLIVNLAESGLDLNSKDESGQTPLHYAVERGLIRCMDALLDHGANPHLNDDSGISPISWAVIAGKEQATQQLLFESAALVSANMGLRFIRKPRSPSLEETQKEIDSVLTWAARLGRISIATMIMERVRSMPGAQLQEAAASGHTDIVRLFLDYGYDPNHRGRDGLSAIHYAAEEGHLDIVKLLLEAGANPNTVNTHGTSPLHCAANGGQASIVSLILKTGQVDTNNVTHHGWTALHHAAYMGHSDVVRLLLEHNPSILFQVDTDGWTALHLAVLRRDLATLRILLDTRPMMLPDNWNSTAEDRLHRWRGQPDLAFVKSHCCQALTGLRLAVTSGSIPLVKLLIKLGHDVNGTQSGNRTALYYAATNRMLPMIDLLISRGADANILPVGRIHWKEVVRDPLVLLRLAKAGYKVRRPRDDQRMDELIHQELLSRERRHTPTPSAPSLPWSNAPAPSLLRRMLPFPMLAQHALQWMDYDSDEAFSEPIHSEPPEQTNDHKRKTRSRKLGDWWKRLRGKKQRPKS